MKVCTVSRIKTAGFTFIEMLVVSVLISVLAAIISVSFVTSGRFTRDARRKRDLANMQASLEAYKLRHGEYPDSSICGGETSWPGCAADWIPGIVPDYANALPVDPRQNYSGAIGSSTDETYTYNYTRLTAVSYHLLAKLENIDDEAANGDEYGYSGTGIYVVVQPR